MQWFRLNKFFFLVLALFTDLLILLWHFLDLRLFWILLLILRDFTLYFIIILKNISYKLTICNIKISFFDPQCFDKSFLAGLVIFLILLNLSVCLFNMGKPLDYFPCAHSSAKNINTGVCRDFQSNSWKLLSVHAIISTIYKNYFM